MTHLSRKFLASKKVGTIGPGSLRTATISGALATTALPVRPRRWSQTVLAAAMGEVLAVVTALHIGTSSI